MHHFVPPLQYNFVNQYKGSGLEKGLQRERERERGLEKETRESERRSIKVGPGYIYPLRAASQGMAISNISEFSQIPH